MPRCVVSSRPIVPAGSPIAAADDVCTTRATPAAAAARTTTAVPSTLARSIGAGSRTHIAFTPATWKTRRASAHASRGAPRVEEITADGSRARVSEHAAAALGAREGPHLTAARRGAHASRAPPTKPLPPVRKAGSAHRG